MSELVFDVTDMRSMFYNAVAFSQNITGWTTNTMGFYSFYYADMFFGAAAWLDAYAYTGNSDVCNNEAPFGPAGCWSAITSGPTPAPTPAQSPI
ncbi:hypothetical protein TrRE_jg1403 [Triparma retinervis]|uniref:BspA family leucine-rich repeat surface protein n=1 Tax=Triparma retinervis TaxID=2557542 RepID=A0A9W6ZVR1_9STRA|nr:hypothetical protein TrRE_jg1403 [Triparma retinervis]